MASQPDVPTAASTQSLYSTAPLNYTGRDIRLVELQRNEASEKIKCVLRSYSDDEPHPPYIALSYAWGSNIRYADIELNGRPFSVARNLWHFLNQMRLSNKFYTYWIDAICIDQTNLRERNHQVQMMRQIYSNAKSVYAWLGEGYEATFSNTAMKYLARREVFKAAKVTTKRFLTRRQAKGILLLCERPYWTRIWIVQELLLAKTVTILCGTKSIPWGHFERFFEDVAIIVHLGWGQHTHVSPLLASAACGIVQTKKYWRGSMSLIQLVTLCCNQKSTEIRDKIFALHGLANDSTGLEIDYGVTIERLLSIVFEHTCMAYEFRLELREARKRLLQIGQMLRDILKVHCSDHRLEAFVRSGESYARCHDHVTITDGLIEESEENKFARDVQRRFIDYMVHVVGPQVVFARPRIHKWMYCRFKSLHTRRESGFTDGPFDTREPPRVVKCVLCRHPNTKEDFEDMRELETGVWTYNIELSDDPSARRSLVWVAWGIYLTHIERRHSALQMYQFLCKQEIIRDDELQRLGVTNGAQRLPDGPNYAANYMREFRGPGLRIHGP